MRGATTTVERTGTWPTIIGLGVLWAAVLANQVWIFALLFIGWALLDITTGESHFIRRINRGDHPTLFWAITISWILMSVLWIAEA